MAPRNQRRYRRGQDQTWREKWTIFKHNRRKASWHELIAYGIILNVFGAALLLIKAQLDKDVIKAAVEQKFRDAGIRVNSTDGTPDDEEITEPSSVLLVMITMGGRMANVVGTMKLYKGLGKYLSDRKRKKFQSTTERIQNGEAETECTELLADCCQIC
uniref:Ion_trans_2 domain-containing protein n=1 Tax=Caenorhabditis tropicalis TaxID=1561998 RepID=A0A1I7TXJ4_9PELO